MEKAFKGAYGVFGVTDFWATMSADIEIQQGKNVADAAKVCSPPPCIRPSIVMRSFDREVENGSGRKAWKERERESMKADKES